MLKPEDFDKVKMSLIVASQKQRDEVANLLRVLEEEKQESLAGLLPDARGLPTVRGMLRDMKRSSE